MPTLLIIRHGQASFGTEDYDVLSEVGQEQARALASELTARGIEPARIVSGGLRRQLDTIAAYGQGRVAVETDPRWNEYDADALLAGYSDSGLRLESGAVDPSAFQDVLDGALLRWIAGPTPAGLEPWFDFSNRVSGAMDELLKGLNPGEVGVVCTSGGVIAAICSNMLGLRGSGFLSFNRVAANTGITKIVRGGRGDHLVTFNEHGHLGRPDGPPLTYR